MAGNQETEASCWMVEGNVVRRRIRGEQHEITGGTKHFRGGAKVFIVADYPGMAETVVVIGRDRSGRFRTVAMDVWLLTNLRAKVAYSPAVLQRRVAAHSEGNGIPIGPSESEVHDAIEKYRLWIDAERSRRTERGHPWWVVEE